MGLSETSPPRGKGVTKRQVVQLYDITTALCGLNLANVGHGEVLVRLSHLLREPQEAGSATAVIGASARIVHAKLQQRLVAPFAFNQET